MSLLLTDEIRKYRAEEVNVAVKIVHEMYKNNTSPEYFKGAIDAIRQIILLPKRLAGASEEQKKIADLLIKEAIEHLEKRTVRALLESE